MPGHAVEMLFRNRQQIREHGTEPVLAQASRDVLIARAMTAAAAAMNEQHHAERIRRHIHIGFERDVIDIELRQLVFHENFTLKVRLKADTTEKVSYTPVGKVSGTSGPLHSAVTSS